MISLSLDRRDLNASHTLGCAGKKNSKTNIGIHDHAGGTRPDQTRKTPKNLCVCVSEEGGNGKGVVSGASSLLSYTLRYVSLVELGTLEYPFVYYESIKRKLKIRCIGVSV